MFLNEQLRSLLGIYVTSPLSSLYQSREQNSQIYYKGEGGCVDKSKRHNFPDHLRYLNIDNIVLL